MWDSISIRIVLCRFRLQLLIPSPTCMYSVWCMSTICAMKCPFNPLRSCFLLFRTQFLRSSKSAASIQTPHSNTSSCCDHLQQESYLIRRKQWIESTVNKSSVSKTKHTIPRASYVFCSPSPSSTPPSRSPPPSLSLTSSQAIRPPVPRIFKTPSSPPSTSSFPPPSCASSAPGPTSSRRAAGTGASSCPVGVDSPSEA